MTFRQEDFQHKLVFQTLRVIEAAPVVWLSLHLEHFQVA